MPINRISSVVSNSMRKLRVLLADPYRIFTEGLRYILNHEKDIECVGTAHDGAEAVKLAKELLPDVVVMDLTLPTIDGAKAAKQIKSACPDTRVVLLSTEKNNQCVTDSMKAQVDGYTSCPYQQQGELRRQFEDNIHIIEDCSGILVPSSKD